jgi:hypothetical protein
VKRLVTKPPFDFPALAALEFAPPGSSALRFPSVIGFQMPVGRGSGGLI